MPTSLSSAPRFTVALLIIVCTAARCEQSDSRRAVSEHQLMHDRGRNIQSLKRLIWLSGAMEGLHTAQSRSAALDPPRVQDLDPPKVLDLDLNPPKVLDLDLNPPRVLDLDLVQSPQAARVQNLLRDFFYNPGYLSQLSERES